jgi:hypothetical protein
MKDEQWAADRPEMIVVYAAMIGFGVLIGLLLGLTF